MRIVDKSRDQHLGMLDINGTYNTLLPELRSFLYRLTCNREVANDLAHDTFLKAIEKQNQFRGESSAKTWLFSIASNLAIDWLRKKKRWPESAQDDARKLAESDPEYAARFVEVSQNSPDGSFDVLEHVNFCFTCISKTLPIEQQVTLLLKDVYDFKVDEISIIVDCPHGTVKHWLFTARKSMSEIFDNRCALINKTGTCYQCSELNGFFNPNLPPPGNIFPQTADREELYRLRTNLIKAINPTDSKGSAIEDEIMKVLRKAIAD